MGTNIREGKDVTELLLNYRKDGTPFYNLLVSSLRQLLCTYFLLTLSLCVLSASLTSTLRRSRTWMVRSNTSSVGKSM